MNYLVVYRQRQKGRLLNRKWRRHVKRFVAKANEHVAELKRLELERKLAGFSHMGVNPPVGKRI